MPPMTAADLLAVLGILVLERHDDGRFTREGTPPLWYLRLGPDEGPEFDVAARFPFLEAWLPTAENFWGSKEIGRIKSGEWLEATPTGKDLPLRASAVVLDNERLLLVEHVRSEHERMKGLLQTARENKLEHEEAASLRYALRQARARLRALRELAGERLLRVRRDGTVLEPEGAVLPESWAAPVREQGLRALQTGALVRFEGPGGARGAVAPIGDDEFWASLPAV